MKTYLQLFSLIFLYSCAGITPTMDQKVKIWNGAPEENGICRMSTKSLKKKSDIPLPVNVIKVLHQGTDSKECIQATDEAFKKYACLTFQDLGVLYDYIEKLIYQCKKW